MRLHQFFYSPFAAKVRRCLELKGLAYEAVEVPYLDRRELAALTGGYVHVPVLEDAGRVITDSARIAAYLDERYPHSLRQDPVAVLLEAWADGPLEDAAFRVACPGLDERFGAAPGAGGPADAWAGGGRPDARPFFRLIKERRYGAGCIEAWRRDAELLSSQLAATLAPVMQVVSRRPYLLGEQPSVGDAAVYGQLFMVEYAVPGWQARWTPGLRDWWERICHARLAPA